MLAKRPEPFVVRQNSGYRPLLLLLIWRYLSKHLHNLKNFSKLLAKVRYFVVLKMLHGLHCWLSNTTFQLSGGQKVLLFHMLQSLLSMLSLLLLHMIVASQ